MPAIGCTNTEVPVLWRLGYVKSLFDLILGEVVDKWLTECAWWQHTEIVFMRVFSMFESPWGIVCGSVRFLILFKSTCLILSESILFRTISLRTADPAHTKDIINVDKNLTRIIRAK